MDGAFIESSIQQLQQQQQQQQITKKKSKNKKKNSSSEVVKAPSTSACNSTTRTKAIEPRINVCDDVESKVNENGLENHLKQQFHLDEQVNGLVITLGNGNKNQSTTIKQTPANHNCELVNGSNINATISNATSTTTIISTVRPIVNFNDMKGLQPASKVNGHHSSPSPLTSTPSLSSNRNKNECGNVDDVTAKKNKRKGNHKKHQQNNKTGENCNNSSCTTNKERSKDDYSRHDHSDSQKAEKTMVSATEIPCSNNCGSLTTCVYDTIEETNQDDQQQQLPNGYLASVIARIEALGGQKCYIHPNPSSHSNTATIITAYNTCNNSLLTAAKIIINDNDDKKVINSNSSNSETESYQQEQSLPSETNNAIPTVDLSTAQIEYKEYESELQMHNIMRLIQAELSEPYSIYTYRYFIYNWPKLCFLAAHGNDYVGAIVCKLDMHLNVRRGYIAMLAVRKEYRKLKIGTTLVQKAIEAMLADNADEVVLETEMSNVPALRLYENLGFVRDKRLFRYYLNGVDALRLKLWFR